MYYNSSVKITGITDGTSNTLLAGERYQTAGEFLFRPLLTLPRREPPYAGATLVPEPRLRPRDGRPLRLPRARMGMPNRKR
jgi:hypothetical protein